MYVLYLSCMYMIVYICIWFVYDCLYLYLVYMYVCIYLSIYQEMELRQQNPFQKTVL